MIRRTILEWGRLPFERGRHVNSEEGRDDIPCDAADRLAAVAAASPLAGRDGDGVLKRNRCGLQARGVVGVIVTKDCALEILPKIDTAAHTGSVANGQIRARLIHMLGVALDIRIEAGAITPLDFQRETLLEVLIRLFAAKLVDALGRGLPRRYASHADDLPILRGRLNIKRQFTILIAAPQKLACRYDTFCEDNPINQVIKAAVRQLIREVRAPDTWRRLQEILMSYAGVSDVPVQALRWDRVIIDRTNARWKELVDLSRLLLGNRFQTTSTGEAAGFSLTFEMSALFEAYVARMLARALAGSGRSVLAQGGLLPCLRTADGRGLFQTRPDILVKRGDAVEQIIDTKWKLVSQPINDRKQGVAQSDVYQMMAYGQLYGCSRLTLLYPHHRNLGSAPLRERYRLAVLGRIELDVATVDVSTNDDLAQRLRAICPQAGWSTCQETE